MIPVVFDTPLEIRDSSTYIHLSAPLICMASMIQFSDKQPHTALVLIMHIIFCAFKFLHFPMLSETILITKISRFTVYYICGNHRVKIYVFVCSRLATKVFITGYGMSVGDHRVA